MPQLHVHVASRENTHSVLSALDAELAVCSDSPRLIFAFYGCELDDERLHGYLVSRFPGSPIIGGSSFGGVMTHHGITGPNSVAVMLVDDAGGDYGVAAAPLGDDPGRVAQSLLEQALAQCNCSGELPELIWIYQAPGREEAVVEGLRRVVGDTCPIVGGSSADNDVSGHWRQLGPAGPMSDGLVVAVLLPSTRIGFAFQGGYEPAGPSGVVTGLGYQPNAESGVVTATSGREIQSIDGFPAAEVYDRWIGHRIAPKLDAGGSILAETTMFPLAVDAGRVDGVRNYLLIHPESVSPARTLRTFRNVDVGARIYAMRGDRKRLVERAGRVAQQAQAQVASSDYMPAGGLVVYCGGCRLAIGDAIGDVAATVAQTFRGAPFVGCFTFGEQGLLVDRNVHGNLMISAVAFSR
jgi:hypothetical protein